MSVNEVSYKAYQSKFSLVNFYSISSDVGRCNYFTMLLNTNWGLANRQESNCPKLLQIQEWFISYSLNPNLLSGVRDLFWKLHQAVSAPLAVMKRVEQRAERVFNHAKRRHCSVRLFVAFSSRCQLPSGHKAVLESVKQLLAARLECRRYRRP